MTPEELRTVLEIAKAMFDINNSNKSKSKSSPKFSINGAKDVSIVLKKEEGFCIFELKDKADKANFRACPKVPEALLIEASERKKAGEKPDSFNKYSGVGFYLVFDSEKHRYRPIGENLLEVFEQQQ